MAIKVNGTTVINDSRQLQNVQSVDATTVASLGAAGVGGGKNNSLVIVQDTSGTLTIPIAGDVVFIAVGGGGGGAGLAYPNSSVSSAGATTYSASGGAGGGTAIKKLTGVSAGSTYTCTIGAGGTRPSGISSHSSGPTRTGSGGAGGQTTISGTGISLTANGGSGGNFSNSGNSTSGAGGTASGGDSNFTGGTSSTSGVTGAVGDYSATWVTSGGGAPSSTGTGSSGYQLNLSNSYSPSSLDNIAGLNTDDNQNQFFYQGMIGSYMESNGIPRLKNFPTKYQSVIIPKAGTGMGMSSWTNYGSMATNGEWGGGGGGAVRLGGNYNRNAVAGKGGQGFVVAIVFADI